MIPSRIVPPALRWLGIVTLSTFLMVSGLVTVVASPPVSAATGINVYVGYADTNRPNPTNFPTPWGPSTSSINYIGCAPSTCSYDGGAIRIVNNDSAALTVQSVDVDFGGSCDVNFWGSNLTVPANGQLILTQTASGSGDGCPSGGLFDTSDVGPNGSGWSGNCTQSGVQAQINVMIAGSTTTFTDTGEVLNTGGVDKASCPDGSNESTQWTLVGNAPCIGSMLSLSPASQNAYVGDNATVTATLANDCGTPLSGATVDFGVNNGPNAGLTGSGTTNANGQASFTYSSSAVGTDTLQASVTNLVGTFSSNTVTVNWQAMPTTLAYTGPASADYNDATTVSATLTDANNNPIPNQPVTLTLNGAESCMGTTDTNGSASCQITPGEAAGNYTIEASFSGTATLTDTSTTAPFQVTHEETTLAITSSSTLPAGAVQVTAQLLEDGNASVPIAGRPVTFTATPNGGGAADSGTGTTDANGNATATLDLSSGDYTLSATFAGDSYYLPADATAQAHLYVYQPTQFVIWGGNNPDLSQAITPGAGYTFWGAQWAKQVTAGDYTANASFKGYADTVSGTTWTARPGNSSNPPSSVGSYIGVIVATHIDKHGSTIGGNVAELVVLQVDNPGAYAPNPGHPGTGVMVAIIH